MKHLNIHKNYLSNKNTSIGYTLKVDIKYQILFIGVATWWLIFPTWVDKDKNYQKKLSVIYVIVHIINHVLKLGKIHAVIKFNKKE